MQHDLNHTRFAVKAFPAKGSRPRELSRTMAPHPLSYQELPFDPEYTLYNNRLTPVRTAQYISSSLIQLRYSGVRRLL